jgi:hypothetical protein
LTGGRVIDLFTIQIAKWRLARNRDIVFMDTTVKSGFSIFAPTWDMVMGHKLGQISDEEYKKLYYAKMNASWKNEKERPQWLDVIQSKEPIAIGCYCAPGKFCHRHLLKEIFEKLCAARGIPFFYYGELTDD